MKEFEKKESTRKLLFECTDDSLEHLLNLLKNATRIYQFKYHDEYQSDASDSASETEW